jgi:thiol-disulfide isomerase/thioredoxin
VGALAFIGYRLGPQIGALIGIGSGLGPSPEVAFVALDGASVDPQDLEGKVVILNFWATWCGPCRLEMPSLQSLHEDKAKDGLMVLGLSVDDGPTSEIERFLDEKGITYPVGRASSAHRAAFDEIPMIPTTFIIDREGMIRHKIEGYAAGPVLRVAAGRLLRSDE